MHKTNHCFIVGNIGADPVERARGDSGPIVGFSVAENVQAFDRESNSFKTTHTNWFNITAFGSMAERAKRGLKKGDRVAVQGRIKTSKYKDKSGEERTSVEIIAEDIAIWQVLPSAGGLGAERDTSSHHRQPVAAYAEDDLPF